MASNQLTIEMASREVMRLLGIKGGIAAYEAFDVYRNLMLRRFDSASQIVSIEVEPEDLILSLAAFSEKHLSGVAEALRGTNG